MGYELFVQGHSSRRPSAAAIAITKHGRLNLNKAATQILRDQRTEFVLLFFDPDSRKIGIKPSGRNAHAYQVRVVKNGNSSGFHVSTFLHHIRFDYSETRVLYVEFNRKEGMLEAEVPVEFFLKTPA